MNVLYFDCFSGVAGDMLLGALLDAGADRAQVLSDLDCLGLPGWHLQISSVTRAGIRAARAEVTITEEQLPLSYRDLRGRLEDAPLRSYTKQTALKTFRLLARAEANVHGIEADDVHFHEIGSLDALIDIVGCSSALQQLSPDRIVTSAIATGTGTVHAAHGTIPLPAPAVVEILGGTKATLIPRGSAELTTPTGAAFLAAVTDEFGSFPPMQVTRWGYGAGAADLATSNVVRVLIGESVEHAPVDEDAVVVEANIDDMTPELLGHAIDVLLHSGAQDAWVTPIVMKKSRPAFKLSAIVEAAREQQVVDAFFKETTTLGLRRSPVARHILEREWIETTVSGLLVRVKIGRHEGRVTSLAPEYDDAVAVAAATDLPLKEVYAHALRAAEAELARR